MEVDLISKYGLPTEIKFCKKCVMSNQRPRITFDEEGVCSACRHAERKVNIDWDKRENELLRMLDRFRSKDGSHDVIVPCSGGKDSAYVAHQLKYKYGMNPLTVTWAPNIYTDVGRKNLQSFIDAGFDNIMGTPNGEVNRKFVRLAFEHMGDNFQPFIYGVKAFPLTIATRNNIPLIMYAENGEVEYGGDSKNEESPTHDVTDDMKTHYFSGMNQEDWTKYGMDIQDLKYYMPPSIEEMRKIGIECHFMGYYKKWIPQENYYYAVEHTNFEANEAGRSEGTYSKYASLDDKIDGFHYYLGYIKFGIGRGTSDAAHEVRDGHITREEAVALVKKFDGEFPQKYFKDFLEYCDIDEEFFNQVVDKFRSPHIWKKVDGEWKLRHTVWGGGVDD